MAKKLQSIYEYFGEYGYKKENIDLVLSMLNEEEKELIKLRYGEDLENPKTSPEWTKVHNQKFYSSLLPRIKKILLDLHTGKTKKRTKRSKANVEISEKKYLLNKKTQ